MAKITWYGHSCVLIETQGTRLLIDPFLTGNPVAPVRADAVHPHYILVSHGHGDHLGDTVAIAKRTGATVISNFELSDCFAAQGVENTHAQHIAEMEGIRPVFCSISRAKRSTMLAILASSTI